jgi:hypothetical protein
MAKKVAKGATKKAATRAAKAAGQGRGIPKSAEATTASPAGAMKPGRTSPAKKTPSAKKPAAKKTPGNAKTTPGKESAAAKAAPASMKAVTIYGLRCSPGDERVLMKRVNEFLAARKRTTSKAKNASLLEAYAPFAIDHFYWNLNKETGTWFDIYPNRDNTGRSFFPDHEDCGWLMHATIDPGRKAGVRKSAETFLRGVLGATGFEPVLIRESDDFDRGIGRGHMGKTATLDLRWYFDAIYDDLRERVRGFDPTAPGGPGEPGPVRRLDVGFDYYPSGWIVIVFDTRPDAEMDGEWNSYIEGNDLELPGWGEAGEASLGGQVTLIGLDGVATTLPPESELAEPLGELLKAVLLKAGADGVFDALPKAPGFELGVEHQEGAYGWSAPLS